jgi:hypothetical protein
MELTDLPLNGSAFRDKILSHMRFPHSNFSRLMKEKKVQMLMLKVEMRDVDGNTLMKNF